VEPETAADAPMKRKQRLWELESAENTTSFSFQEYPLPSLKIKKGKKHGQISNCTLNLKTIFSF